MTRNKKKAAALALFAGTFLTLTAQSCEPGHPPTCAVSASGTTAACTFSAEFQNANGRPVVWTRYLCDNAIGGAALQWRDSADVKNLTGLTGDHTTRGYCYPNIVLSMTAESKPS